MFAWHALLINMSRCISLIIKVVEISGRSIRVSSKDFHYSSTFECKYCDDYPNLPSVFIYNMLGVCLACAEINHHLTVYLVDN